MPVLKYLQSIILPSQAGSFRLWLAGLVIIHHLVGYDFGKAPVLVFFALSGYWVRRVWQQTYRATHSPWLTFLVSRWWRIAPMMIAATFVCAAVMFVVAPQALDPVRDHLARHAFSTVLAFGYASLPDRLVGPAWSLDVEMQFYVVAPLLVTAVRRIASRLAVVVCGFLTIAAFQFHIATWASQDGAFFVVGMIAAERGWTASRLWAVVGAALAGLLLAAAIASPWHALVIDPGAPQADLFSHVLAALLLPAALASVNATSRPQASRRDGGMDRAIGDMSFIVYLMHWPLVLIVRNVAWADANYRLATVGVLFAIVLPGLSLAMWTLVDRPLNRWRKDWVLARRVQRDARAPAHQHAGSGGLPEAGCA